MEKTKKYRLHADDGFAVGDGIILLFSMLAVTLMIVVGMNTYTNMAKKDNATLIARQCIIKMETDGYLSEEVKADYIAQLQAADVSDISFTGSTVSPVAYGGKITLKITGKLLVREPSLRGFKMVIIPTKVPFEITLTSTSKC